MESYSSQPYDPRHSQPDYHHAHPPNELGFFQGGFDSLAPAPQLAPSLYAPSVVEQLSTYAQPHYLKPGAHHFLPMEHPSGEFLPMSSLPSLRGTSQFLSIAGHLPPDAFASRPLRTSDLLAAFTPLPSHGALNGGRLEARARNKGQVLHRNKACLSCRSRKTKCDAMKPICSSCKKLGAEVDCRYDSPPKWLEAVTRGARVVREGGPGSQDEQRDDTTSDAEGEKQMAEALEKKLHALEEQLKELRVSAAASDIRKKHKKRLQASISTDAPSAATSKPPPPESHAAGAYSKSRQTGGTVLVRNADGTFEAVGWEAPAASPPESASSESADSLGDSFIGSSQMSGAARRPSAVSTAKSTNISQYQPPEPTCAAMSEPGWPRNLPTRKICMMLVKAFFGRPLASYTLVDSGKFMARLSLPPTHPSFPQASLIHAMAATGAMELSMHALGSRPYWGHAAGGAAEYHAQWCDRLIWDSLITEKNPRILFEHAQSASIMSQYYHMKGMPLHLWRNHGFTLRICVMLGLHKYNPASTNDVQTDDSKDCAIWSDGLSELGPPVDAIDAYERTMLWWYSFSCERIVAAAAGFSVTICEDDISAPIPSTHAHLPEFECHSLKSPTFFESHEVDGSGSIQLLCKANVLLGRVTTFLQRSNHPAVTMEQSAIERAELSNTIRRFFESIPAPYKAPIKVDAEGRIDACLLSAHVMIHSTVVHLHEDAARLSLTCPDLMACANSAKILMSWYHHVANRNVDIGVLLCSNPPVNFALTIALRTHIRVMAVHDALGHPDVAKQMLEEVTAIVRRLRESKSLPMGGRSLILIEELLRDPSVCLPAQQDIKLKTSFLRSIGRVKS